MADGFCVFTNYQKCKLNIFSEYQQNDGKLLSIYRTKYSLAIILGRIYYGAELLKNNFIKYDEENLSEYTLNPAKLALTIYQQLGWKALSNLEGEYALSLLDISTQTIIASRDPLGGYPLYYLQEGSNFSLATSIAPLLSYLSLKKISMEYLADFLTLVGPINESSNENCIFESIRRIQPGFIYKFDLKSRKEERWSYWNWNKNFERFPSLKSEEIAKHFIDLLHASVKERAIGVVASHLSGGMDSTTIALLARNYLQGQNRSTPLHAISLVYRKLKLLSYETRYLEVAWNQPGLIVHKVPADNLLDFDIFKDPPFHNEPYIGLWRFAMDRATIIEAANHGANTVLTGLGADEILDWQPFHLADLIKKGHFSSAWSIACDWAKANSCSPWHVLSQFGISSALRSNIPSFLQKLLFFSKASLKGSNSLEIAPWVRNSFARRYCLYDRAIKQLQYRYQNCTSTSLSFVLNSINSRIGDVARWSLALPLGIHISHPFLDLRVLRFGISLLDYIEPTPHRLKPLLIDATKNLLPELIRTRNTKSHFNEVYYLGLARNLSLLRSLIENPIVKEIGWLDKDLLLQYIQLGSLGGIGVRPLHGMNATLSLLCWLANQEKWFANPKTPDETIEYSLTS